MAANIRWLHISDLHFGKDTAAQDVHFKKVLDHVQEFTESGFSPHKVFITGDVGNSGKKDEYTQFRSVFLDKLETLLPVAEIIIAPGNHDLIRSPNSQLFDRTVLTDESKCQIYDPTAEALKSRAVLVSNFEHFCELPNCEWLKGETGFRYIAGNEQCPVDVICLNTAWIAWGDDENFSESGKLPIGVTAIETAFSKISAGRALIVLGHHPLNWLNDTSREALIRNLKNSGGLYLCGHEHQARLDAYHSISAAAYQLRAGAAFLGRLPTGQDWTNSLMWGELQDDGGGNALLRIRPRYWDNAQGWRLWTSNFPGNPTSGGWYEFTLQHHANGSSRSSSRRATATTTTMLEVGVSRTSGSPTGSRPESLDKYFDLLESKFDFTYRRRSSLSTTDRNYVLFWPVRARQPTLVHAMQAFSAAGMAIFGSKVMLVLDDLSGQTIVPTSDLEAAIKQWFNRVGADSQGLAVFKLSEMQPEINKGERWIGLITKWFAIQNEYKLNQILEISKLQHAKLSEKKARKLLTPTLVWSAFSVLMARNPECRYVTLGGADERPLWEAWRACIDGDSLATHMFNPEVKDEREQRFDLDRIAWPSFSEIRETITQCINSFEGDLSRPPQYWLPFVAYKSCVVLPSCIANQPVEEWSELVSKYGRNRDDLASHLANKIFSWFLKER